MIDPESCMVDMLEMLEIKPISAFNDNYIWLLRQTGGCRLRWSIRGCSPVIQHLVVRDWIDAGGYSDHP